MAHIYKWRPVPSTAYYTAIGRVVAIWAALEIKIDEQLLRMLSEDRARDLRIKRSLLNINDIPKAFRGRIDICNEFAPIFYAGKELKDILGITKRCMSLQKDRNRLAHGEWIMEHFARRPPKILSQLRYKGLKGKQRLYSLKQMRQTAHDISDLVAMLDRFMDENHPGGHWGKRLSKYLKALAASHKNANPPANDGKPT